jgi:hypothetical protein
MISTACGLNAELAVDSRTEGIRRDVLRLLPANIGIMRVTPMKTARSAYFVLIYICYSPMKRSLWCARFLSLPNHNDWLVLSGFLYEASLDVRRHSGKK